MWRHVELGLSFSELTETGLELGWLGCSSSASSLTSSFLSILVSVFHIPQLKFEARPDTMENLPPELLAKVVQNLPRCDLPRLRLISRTIAAEVAPFVFSTIPLWIDLKSLEALTSISEDPRLSTYVKTIAFSPLRFIELEDHKICDRQVRDTLEFQPGSSSSHINHLKQHVAVYDIAGQRYLASGSLDVKILSQALSKLPKFKSLILDYDHGRTVRLYQVFRGRGGRPDMVTMDGDYSLPVLFTALSNAKVAITSLTIRDSWQESFCSNDSSIRLPGSEVGTVKGKECHFLNR